jgi:hypothetical protein
MAALITKPSLIEAANMKFLIIDAPREQNLHLYLKEFKKVLTHLLMVTVRVRVRFRIRVSVKVS